MNSEEYTPLVSVQGQGKEESEKERCKKESGWTLDQSIGTEGSDLVTLTFCSSLYCSLVTCLVHTITPQVNVEGLLCAWPGSRTRDPG